MSKLTILKCLEPRRLAAGLRHRGVAGAAWHGLRKAGTIAGRAWVGPYQLGINPVQAVCNHACPMCWLQHRETPELKALRRDERERGLKLADYERIFSEMPAGWQELNVSGGGEPLLHPEILGILAAGKRRRGVRGMLITNGSLLDATKARALVGMRWDLVRVSVHCGTRDVYRAIHGVDRFETTLANLKAFDRLRREANGPDATPRSRMAVMFVIQHENIPAIESCFTFAEAVGADEMIFKKIMPYDGLRFLSAAELSGARERLLACARDSRIPVNLDEIVGHLHDEESCLSEGKPFVPARRCSIGFDWTYLNSVGDVIPCCFSDEVMGNLREQSFYEIWHGPKYRDFRERLINGRFAKYCIDNRCTMRGVLHN